LITTSLVAVDDSPPFVYVTEIFQVPEPREDNGISKPLQVEELAMA